MRNRMHGFQICIFATLLSSVIFLEGCVVPTWVNTVEAIAETAAPIAGSIVSIVDPAAAPIVTLAEQGFEALTKTLDTYKASPTATNLQAVGAAFAAVNANVSQLENAAQIKNAGTQSTITQVVDLLTQAVSEIGQYVPANQAASMGLTAGTRDTGHGARGWKAKDFKKAFNQLAKFDHRLKPLK